MGLLSPEAQVKGLAGLSFIALICSKYPAKMSELGSVNFIEQSYKVFVGSLCLHLLQVGPKDEPHPDLAAIRQKIEDSALAGSPSDLLVHFNGGPQALFRLLFPCTKMHEAAGGLVFNLQRDLLVIIRRGIPDLPKGHLDHGETFEQAAIREVTEETGVRKLSIITPASATWHAYHQDDCWHLKLTRWYAMLAAGQQRLRPQREEEITDIRWVGRHEADDYLERTFRSIREVLGPVIRQYMSGEGIF